MTTDADPQAVCVVENVMVDAEVTHPVLRKVYSAADITGESCMTMRREIEALAAVSNDPITLVLSTEGGDCDAALGLIDYILRCPCSITIEVSGFCWSVGAWILQAADHRVMSQSSSLLLHNGEEGVQGSKFSVKNWAKHNDITENYLMSLLCRRTKKDKRYWTRVMRDGDVILTAKQALSLNLIDEVL